MGAANCEPSSKAGNWLRELMARNLFLHGKDREHNFTKFCAAGLLCAPLYSVENTCVPAYMSRLLIEGL
jgi:hypothetical protein